MIVILTQSFFFSLQTLIYTNRPSLFGRIYCVFSFVVYPQKFISIHIFQCYKHEPLFWSPSIKILTIFSQMGCNHVYKLLYLVTYMGPATANLFTTPSRGSHYYAIPWNLVQHSTSYSFKYTHCLLFMILINILRGVYAHSNLLLYSKTKYQLITNFCTHVIPLFTKHCIRINVF